MKNNRILISLITVIIFGFTASPVFAANFSDDFTKGKIKKWDFSYSPYGPGVSGNWRFENGVLKQDFGGDSFVALVKNKKNTNQIVQTQVSLNGPSGYGGVTVWFKDRSNWVSVRLYPAAEEIWVDESVNNTVTSYRYPHALEESYLYTLKVVAKSKEGRLDISLDNTFILTHNVITTNREGLSGLYAGNAGGYFDNFTVEKLKTK